MQKSNIHFQDLKWLVGFCLYTTIFISQSIAQKPFEVFLKNGNIIHILGVLTKNSQVLSLHAVLPGLGLLHPLGLGGHLWGPGSKSATGSQREDGGLRGDGAHHQRAGAGVERDPLSGGGRKGGRL